MPKKVNIDPDELKRLWHVKTTKELAEHFKCSRWTIYVHGAKNGLPRRNSDHKPKHRKSKKIDPEELKRLWFKKTPKELEKHFKCCKQTLYRHAKRLGLTKNRRQPERFLNSPPKELIVKRVLFNLQLICREYGVTAKKEDLQKIAFEIITRLPYHYHYRKYLVWAIYHYLSCTCDTYITPQSLGSPKSLKKKGVVVKQIIDDLFGGGCSMPNRARHLIHDYAGRLAKEIASMLKTVDDEFIAQKLKQYAFEYFEGHTFTHAPSIVASTCVYLAMIKAALNDYKNKILSQDHCSRILGCSAVSIRNTIKAYFTAEYRILRKNNNFHIFLWGIKNES
jgi:hypothetical protein